MEKYIDISSDKFNKKNYNPDYATGSFDLTKKTEELSLIELELIIFYFRCKFREYLDFMAKDGKDYSTVLFKLASLLTKLETIRDIRFNELSNIEKREHLLNFKKILELYKLSNMESKKRKPRK